MVNTGLKSRSVMTIGYEGLEIDKFLEFLSYHKVEVLVDVREVPISRKRGFSKSRLSQALDDAGIEYVHMKDLGSPKDIRSRLKVDHDYDAFFSAYDSYLETQTEALDQLIGLVTESRRVCLMCFESSHDQCHRSHIASHIADRTDGLNVEPVNTWVR